MSPETIQPQDVTARVESRARELLDGRRRAVHEWTDRMFSRLMLVQWLAAILAACWISPRTWAGSASETHLHVWAALLFGGTICSLPVLLTLARPGWVGTRHTMAAAQMLMSALLIHLAGGRIETHFHVFGSLAFLSFYRDGKVLLTASLVIALDHFLRGTFWPESVFGLLDAGSWRWLEHAAWVIFEVTFLLAACRQNQREMRQDAWQRALLENTNEQIEWEVERRTSEIEQGRQRLELSERRVRLAVEAAPNGMIMVNHDGVITLVNSKIEEMFGYARHELLGQKIEVLVPERYRGNHPELRQGYFERPDTRAMGEGRDLAGVRKDGSEFPVELGLNPLQTDEGTQILAAVVDITPRKQAEARIQQSLLELERKNRELDEFTYVASHDLQEPIRKLVSFSKLLRQDIGGTLNEQAEKDLQFIVDAAQRMRQLIQDLLALSRAGRSAMKSEVVDMQCCFEKATEALELRVRETGASIDSDPLPSVRGDATVLTQLYQNLIGNALKFCRPDVPPRIALTAERKGDTWVLGVQDNGIGIPGEYAERIFAPFQRLHSRRDYDGTGIGLAICKKSVERHGGEIWVESQPGKGAHFQFTLPAITELDECPTRLTEPQNALSSC